MLGSASGLNDAHLGMIEERGAPQPYATFTSPLCLTRRWPPGLSARDIICTAGGMSAAMLRELIEPGARRAGALAAPDWELYQLSTGQWAMFPAPVELARLLRRIATTDKPA